jgi:hypothetical protein
MRATVLRLSLSRESLLNYSSLNRADFHHGLLGAWQIFKKPFSPKTFSDHVLNLFRER